MTELVMHSLTDPGFLTAILVAVSVFATLLRCCRRSAAIR